jgi:hypothetical protein
MKIKATKKVGAEGRSEAMTVDDEEDAQRLKTLEMLPLIEEVKIMRDMRVIWR